MHLVGLGREIIDPRSGRKVPVAGACTFGTSIEMILLERVPYVLHALDPDNKAAWYGQMFEKTFSHLPCMLETVSGCRELRTS